MATRDELLKERKAIQNRLNFINVQCAARDKLLRRLAELDRKLYA